MGSKAIWIALIFGIGGFLCLVSLLSGSLNIGFSGLMDTFFHYDSSNTHHYVILNLRLPRLIMALLSGASLAISGYLFQSLLNNPLADPYILGTASGASLGANLVFAGLLPLSFLGFYLPPVMAFICAMTITLLGIAFAYKDGRVIATNLLLAGVALSSVMTAFISLIGYLSEGEGQLRSIIFWIMGSFERSNWSQIPLMSIVTIAGVIYFSIYNKSINVLLLGEARAEAIGLNVKKMRWVSITGATLLTAVTVSHCGAIGFVGFLIPHFVRGVFGFSFRYNILFAAITGGFFMVFCDILSLWIYPPAGLPLGILTSFLGIPFFLYLLSKRDYRFQ